MAKDEVTYGTIRTVAELGRLARAHRKSRRLTLETVSGLSTLSTRFLSEFGARQRDCRDWQGSEGD
jgi:HTH-type transcriptional regulator/antitoxin HipB